MTREETSSRTQRFEATVGMQAGYSIDPSIVPMSAPEMAVLWQALAEKVAGERGVWVTAVIRTALVSYAADHGCPDTGEPLFVIHGERNPRFDPDEHVWRAAVVDVVNAVADYLDQVTARVVFSTVTLYYLRRTEGTPS